MNLNFLLKHKSLNALAKMIVNVDVNPDKNADVDRNVGVNPDKNAVLDKNVDVMNKSQNLEKESKDVAVKKNQNKNKNAQLLLMVIENQLDTLTRYYTIKFCFYF